MMRLRRSMRERREDGSHMRAIRHQGVVSTLVKASPVQTCASMSYNFLLAASMCSQFVPVMLAWLIGSFSLDA